MNFQRSEEQQMIIENLRKFLDNEIEPAFREHGEGFIPREKMQGWVQALTEFGMTKAPFGEEWGGFGMDWLTHLMVFEEVAYTSLDIAIPGFINACGAELLRRTASEEIQQKYIPDILACNKFIAIGISEPDVGSDVAAVKTRAVLEGDHWVINGEKTWITNGEYADVFICTCLTGEGELTHILVDREEHGFETVGIPKMALNGQSTSQVFLSDVRVPVSNTIGERGQGLKNTLKIFEYARCHMSMWGVGVARRAMDESIKYSQERKQHGKLIAGHQLIADKIATMATKIDAARLLTYRAIDMVERGARADKECAMAKWFGTEIAVTAARDAVEIHGGNGVTKEFIVERLAREAIVSPIPDGTTEIQKLIISRALTGEQAFR
ncbi:MAG: acyl-CoA dehydrogenase [Rhodospirillaceae bacterium]|uniref:Acyl-CoA dehydrogenase n=1 Tax=Halioxenophilus aromaticivorans TaxID=1306992 RepID=A0AAV3U7D7_9ALTE|nr:acyl-CoA dehydrogenase [Rhodospirillaceae bacterium]|tara:strand:+ start:7127 stop:8272 length:1146 start_codon:yes stop_codon:yes gene_type:complete